METSEGYNLSHVDKSSNFKSTTDRGKVTENIIDSLTVECFIRDHN